jgi:hypothetical protein
MFGLRAAPRRSAPGGLLRALSLIFILEIIGEIVIGPYDLENFIVLDQIVFVDIDPIKNPTHRPPPPAVDMEHPSSTVGVLTVP